MGCYGIGPGRILASIIEQNHDENGIVLPVAIAPYHVIVVPVNNKDEEQILVNRLTINSLLEKLEKREKEIILLRYYKGKTQSQVGKILGITQVQVSRIEKKILDRMRLNLEAVWEKFFYILF